MSTYSRTLPGAIGVRPCAGGSGRIVVALLGIAFTTGAESAAAQYHPERSGLWGGAQLGYGSLARSSDQEPHDRAATFALGFILGGTVTGHLRLGAEIDGWLLEAGNVNDPAKGESVSQALAIAQVYPWSARGLFLKTGVGRAVYNNSHPAAFGSSGWGQTLGVGCDLPINNRLAITPSLNYSRGSLGDVTNQLVTINNRSYGVFDFRIAVTSQ